MPAGQNSEVKMSWSLSYPIFFIMHENLFQGNSRGVSFRPSFVNFTMSVLVQWFYNYRRVLTQKYLLQAFPETRSLEYLSTH